MLLDKWRFSFVCSCLTAFLLLLLPAKGSAINYGYDSLNRLTSVTYENGSAITYRYDATGNIMAVGVVLETTPPCLSASTPAPGATGVAPTSLISVTFSEAVTEASALAAITVTGPGGATVAGQKSFFYDTLSFAPSAALQVGATYTVRVAGVIDMANNVQTVANTWTFTVASTAKPLLAVQTSGSGSGTITSTPQGINCITGSAVSCSAAFDLNRLVSLHSVPAWYSSVVWGGCSANGSDCTVTMSADKTVTATYGILQNVRVQPGNHTYGRISDACTTMSAAATLQLRDSTYVTFLEDLLFDKPYTITLDGGKDASWNTVGATAIDGSLRINAGQVIIKGPIKIY